jgi:hypothetical protein
MENHANAKGINMTQNEIIEVAKQAGFQTGFINYMSGLGGYPFVKVIGTGEVLPNLERFAKLVAAKAIKELESQEPVALPCCGYTDASAVKWNPFNGVMQCHNCGQNYTTSQRTEPPAWFPAVENILNEYGLQAIDFVADFKAAMKDAEQSQRTWVGLTVEEIKTICVENGWDSSWQSMRFAYAIEAKLKEKNT